MKTIPTADLPEFPVWRECKQCGAGPDEGCESTCSSRAKTIPTTDLPDSAFRDTAGIPTHIDTEPTLPTNVACLPGRDYVSPYTDAERCRCGAIVEGVDQKQLRVVVHPASKTQPRRVYIVSCPMCPNRR